MTKKQASAQGEQGNGGATIGYESELWAMADALRGSMDASEYKHVTLGLIFLKYVSDAFEEMRRRLESERDQGADPEHPDTGTVFGAITKGQLEAFLLVEPPQGVIDHFRTWGSALDLQTKESTNQMFTLNTLRDTLLPKLVSGEVRVDHFTSGETCRS